MCFSSFCPDELSLLSLPCWKGTSFCRKIDILGLVLWMVKSDEEVALPWAGLAAFWLCL